jgi:hypothetical protein
MIATGISWPVNWNWFDFIKEQSKNSFKKSETGSVWFFKSTACEVNEIELPADIYIGGALLLAGALCMIVGTVITPFYAAGTILLGDGATRVYNGVSQLGEERRNDPNYIKPDFGRSNF